MFNIAKKATKVKRQTAQKPEKKTQMGISVIEVLIVVAILLLLMVALYRTIGRDVDKARDADRKKDLKEIKIAFENYYNDKNCYPPEGSLDVCGSTDLAPYLAQVPCDKLGTAYLYLPVANAEGATCGGYRILTPLTILNDPMIEQAGCPGGCGGIPVGLVDDPEAYNYGIAEGVPLRQATVPEPTVDPIECSLSNDCFCCNNPPSNCNKYNGSGYGSCHSEAYASNAECVAATSCEN
jgi:type II secretory pathway pseudopilin PulG